MVGHLIVGQEVGERRTAGGLPALLAFLLEQHLGGVFLWLDIALGIQLWALTRRYRQNR